VTEGPCEHLTWLKDLSCWNRMTDPVTKRPVAWHGIGPGQLVAIYPLDWRAGRGMLLGQAFSPIRTACDQFTGRNCPIIIGSAYRPYEYDKDVGGVSGQHVAGKAMDLWTPVGLTTDQFHEIVREAAQRVLAIGATGFYEWGCHVDVRPRVNGRVVRWDG
jgi:hypothetical protein